MAAKKAKPNPKPPLDRVADLRCSQAAGGGKKGAAIALPLDARSMEAAKMAKLLRQGKEAAK